MWGGTVVRGMDCCTANGHVSRGFVFVQGEMGRMGDVGTGGRMGAVREDSEGEFEGAGACEEAKLGFEGE
jgi:hypothetical protein